MLRKCHLLLLLFSGYRLEVADDGDLSSEQPVELHSYTSALNHVFHVLELIRVDSLEVLSALVHERGDLVPPVLDKT
jgi:hypothetical protein